MGSLFRSEEMTLCQLFIQAEAAYNCISELGELGLLQFRDLNNEVNAFQRKFVSEIRRCDEMERNTNVLEAELIRDNIVVPRNIASFHCPGLREETQLESHLLKLVTELNEINQSALDMKKNELELIEVKHILVKSELFYNEAATPSTSSSQEIRRLSMANVKVENRSFLRESSANDELRDIPFHDLEVVTGVLEREKLLAYETMLWRISRGNIFVRHEDIADKLVDPVTGEEMSKVVFVAYFQGVHLRDKVEKVSQGFRATIYSVPDNDKTRKDMLKKVNGQLDDMETVGRETAEMKRKLLVATAKSIHGWQIKIKKMKAVYYTLNMFNLNVAHNMFIGEAWCPLVDLDKAQAALNKATEFSGSSVPSLINKMAAKESPPSFNRTNKFTEGFQLIVNAYGVSNYREVNPAPYTIITFPFLFACMFGDLGHGLLMFLFALVLVLKENSFKSKAATSEMFGMFFGGRYIILLMGVFSMYTGIIYNDTFSKGINIFGSSWRAAHGHGPNSSVQEHHLNLMPGSDYSGTPYPFGIDPVWMIGENKILFLNSYKMKLSVILGVFQMLFGVSLSSINHTFFEKRINLFCEFMPQVIFLLVIFGYMDFMIVYKWFAYSSDNSACAPSVLIMLINMFMMSYPEEPCHLAPMYPGQRVVQTALVIIALVCIPWMLIVKPVLISRQRKADKGFLVQYNASTRRPSRMVNTDTGDEELANDQVTVDIVAEPRNAANSSEHEKEESMSDVIIHQAIHTIEYCLGSISHTASYLRLWALSLAHAQLSEVLWNMVMRIGLATSGVHGGFVLYAVFALWSTLTVAILLLMEGLSAFLHALRLHWVEFQSKFYTGSGYAFEPFCFKAILAVRPD